MNLDKPFHELNDDERVEYSMRMRHDLLNMFMRNTDGTLVSMLDKDNGTLVRTILKDIDSSIFVKRRLAVDEVSAESDKKIAELAESFMERVVIQGRDKGNFEATGHTGPVIDESLLPKFAHTNGETEAVGNDVDIDEITRQCRAELRGDSDED